MDGGCKLMHENHWLNSIDTDFMPGILNYIFVWIFGSLLFYVSENWRFDLVQGFIDYHNFDMVFIDCCPSSTSSTFFTICSENSFLNRDTNYGKPITSIMLFKNFSQFDYGFYCCCFGHTARFARKWIHCIYGPKRYVQRV